MAGNRTLKLSILADIDDLKKGLDAGDKEIEGFGGKLEKFGKVAAAAFAAAAAAAAAYAGKLVLDGVKAAAEDEAAQEKLATALKNVTGATDTQIASVEKQIEQLSLANGIADEKLRPAFQRLATSTNDLGKSQDLLKLALDVSAGSGKDLETVTNALAKAYDGNEGALSRLGVGLSAAELKSMSFDEITAKLGNTFKDQAEVKASSFAGQIEVLKNRFDEAKESVGSALLPKLTEFLNLLTDKIIPKVQEFAKKALEPVQKAIADNKEELQLLYDFAKDFIVPFFSKTLGVAFAAAGKAISGVINLVSNGIDAVKAVVNTVIDAINLVIKGYNALPGVKDISLVGKIVENKSSGSNEVPAANRPGKAIGGSVLANVPYIVGEKGPELFIPQTFGNIIPNNKLGGAGSTVVVNVYAPSAIDEEGFTRSVINALNSSQYRLGGGGAQLVL